MMDSNPLVTVYITTRNYEHYLSQAVQSVIDQLYKNWELFIIDDGSTDKSHAVAERFAALHPGKIQVIRNDEPTGLQKIANKVLGQCKGKYIVRLDADDWFDEGALLLMTAKLESNPDYGLVYGNYYYTDEAGEILGTERRRKLGSEDISGHTPPHGACTMVATRVLKSVGGYSEDINAQDGWELWFKLVNRTTCVHLDAPLFYYRQHTTSLSRNTNRLLSARSGIFKKARERNEGSYKPTCLAVIPVRESFPDFKDVPYQIFEGKSLLAHAITSAKEAYGVTDVVVTSESEAVLDYSEKLEEEFSCSHKRYLRPVEKAKSSIRPKEILQHAMSSYENETGTKADIVLFLSLHAPRRSADHIREAIDILRTTMSDSVVSVIQETEPMFRHGEHGLQLLNPGRFDGLTYDKEHLYSFNGAIIGLWSDCLQDGLFGTSISYIEMSLTDSLQVKSNKDLL